MPAITTDVLNTLKDLDEQSSGSSAYEAPNERLEGQGKCLMIV